MLKKIIIIVGILVALVVSVLLVLKVRTKSFSPEDTITYNDHGHDIAVTYCRPYKNERTVFPDLIPYDEVWRTGANEATKITTLEDLVIKEFEGNEDRANTIVVYLKKVSN